MLKEPSSSNTYTLTDLPTDEDRLDFTPYVETLVDIIRSPGANTPLTIGVFGTWGAGKTSLMRMVQRRLLVKDGFRTAWFDAWKYDKETALWRALLLQVLEALRKAIPREEEKALGELADLQTTLYRALDREETGSLQIDWGRTGSGLAQGALQIGLSFLPILGPLTKLVEELQERGSTTAAEKLIAAVQRQRTQIHIEQVQFLEQFHARFDDLINTHIRKNKHRLIVFIDDLDRCMPEKAIEALEAIKLFLDVEGCVFMLGLDQDVIARGIELKYRELSPREDSAGEGRFLIEGAHYLEKIIQLPFQIPPIEREDMIGFVQNLVSDWPAADCPHVFAEGLGNNPRQIKRAVNVFLLLWNLAQKRKKKLQGRIKPVRLAKVVTIQNVYPALYEALKRTPRLLRELEDYYRAEVSPLPEGEARSEPGRLEPPPILSPYVNRAAVRRLLTMHLPDTPDVNFSGLPLSELRLYFTLTRRAEAPQVTPAELPREVFEPHLVRIPAGLFTMGSTDAQTETAIQAGMNKAWAEREHLQHEINLPEYYIGKYPVTNTEYRAFVRDAGYTSPQHWDEGEPPPEKGDHPVVNVSWRDAKAYCRWLSEKTGKTYRLPTEAEWEKAARGTDGKTYPWGDEFDPAKCNTKESGLGNTTPVGQYSPQGDSAYGCADMAGNVWEWCNTLLKAYPYDPKDGREDETASGHRVLRGGSWYSEGYAGRASARHDYSPGVKLNDWGFRVVLSLR